MRQQLDTEFMEQNELIFKDTGDLRLVTWTKEKKGELTEIQKQYNGLVIEKETGEVVCECMPVITDITSEMDALDLIRSTSGLKKRFEYCEDGTTIRLFNHKDEWRVSTTRCIDAYKSKWSSEKSFGEMFWEIFNRDLLENLQKTKTYMFVMLHKENRIVIKHRKNLLMYICAIENKTGDVFYENVFTNVETIHRPKLIKQRFMIENYEDLYVPYKRGILLKILKDNTWVTYKLDFKKYKAQKELRGNVPNIQVRYLELLMTDTNAAEELKKMFSEHRFVFTDIKKKFNNFIKNVHTLYIKSHIKHEEQIDETHKMYRTLKQLHASYKTKNNIITRDVVEKHIKQLDPYLVYSLISE